MAAKASEINYAQAKKDFLQLVEHWISSQKPVTKEMFDIHDKSNHEMMVKEILAEKPYQSRNLEYDVLKIDGKTVLVLKKKYKFDPIIQVLNWEEVFDLFMPVHEKSGHKGKEVLTSWLSKYKYPPICLTFLERVCNVCNPTNESQLLPTVSRIGLVFVINMIQMRIDEKFRYLLIYSDKETKFILLRPLIAKTDVEISTELFKIFTQFGPPRQLNIHGYNSDLTEKIDLHLKKICPMFKTIETEHRPVSYDLPTIVTDKIQEWMKTTKSDIWEVGCSVVQKQMNSQPTINQNLHEWNTPHTLFFNTFLSQEKKIDKPTKVCNPRRRRKQPSKPIAAISNSVKKTKRQTIARNKGEVQVTSNLINISTLENASKHASELDNKLPKEHENIIIDLDSDSGKECEGSGTHLVDEDCEYSLQSAQIKPMNTNNELPRQENIEFDREQHTSDENPLVGGEDGIKQENYCSILENSAVTIDHDNFIKDNPKLTASQEEDDAEFIVGV